MKLSTSLALCLLTPLFACGKDGASGHGHSHADGDHSHDPVSETPDEGDHDHEMVPLGVARLGELEVNLAQGHGGIAAGKENHLVVTLPYSDGGASVVRVWIGTEDRTKSMVSKADFDTERGSYDVHATAPSPLPQNAQWWVEIQKPDGTKVVGAADAIAESSTD